MHETAYFFYYNIMKWYHPFNDVTSPRVIPYEELNIPVNLLITPTIRVWSNHMSFCVCYILMFCFCCVLVLLLYLMGFSQFEFITRILFFVSIYEFRTAIYYCCLYLNEQSDDWTPGFDWIIKSFRRFCI